MGILFFFLTIAFIPALPGGANIPRWTMLGVIAALAFWRAVPPTWLWAIVGYFCLMTLVAPMWLDSVYVLWHVVCALLIFCWAQQQVSLRNMALAVGLGATLNSVFVTLQFFNWDIVSHVSAVSGLFNNKVMSAEMTAAVIVLVAGYRFYWLLPGLMPALLLGSRSSMLAVGVAGTVALWKRSQIVAVACATGFAPLAFFGARYTGGWESIALRLGVWQDTAGHLNFLGHGLGAFITDFPLYQHHSNSLMIRFEQAHNDYIQMLYELGIGAALIWGLLVAQMALTERSPEWYCLGALMVEACFGFPLYEPVTLGLFALCAGSVFSRRTVLWDAFDAGRFRIPAWRRDRRAEAL